MEGTPKYNAEKLGILKPHSLPYWIYQALTNPEKDEPLQGERKTEATELALQISRWNLRTAQELIQQGFWTPTPENLEQLERLNKQYTHPNL